MTDATATKLDGPSTFSGKNNIHLTSQCITYSVMSRSPLELILAGELHIFWRLVGLIVCPVNT